jgi:phosphatidylglycerophosphate synthase
MKINEAKLKKVSKLKRGFLNTYLYGYFSVRITRMLLHTKITPNQITILSFIFAVTASIFFLLGNYMYLVIGAIAFQISFILDLVDGEVAIYRGIRSTFGAYFDSFSDAVGKVMVFSSLAYGQFSLNNNYLILVLAILAVSNSLLLDLINYMSKYHFNIKKNILYSKKFNLFIGGVEGTTFLIGIGAILNQVFLTLLFFATIPSIFWMLRLYMTYKSNYTKVIINKNNQN